jgi:hypothetical protein
MATDQRNDGTDPKPAPFTTEPPAPWVRVLAVATAVVFLISSVFPVTAGLSKDTASFPEWWGPLDVGIAFFLALLAFAILGLTHGKVSQQIEQASYRAYRVLTHGLLVMCVVFMVFGDHIILPNCLTGLAWRAWLLLYILPAWLAALGTTAGRSTEY